MELAIVAPILILIIGALVQFAFIFERQIGIDNAIRDAARLAATWDSDSTNAQTNANAALVKVKSLLANSQSFELSRANIQVCVGTPASPNNVDASGQSQVAVTITASYKHPLFLPIVDLILDGIDGSSDRALLATATTSFHVEQTGPVTVSPGDGAVWDGSATTTASCTA